jgi:hypothetical protein
MRIFFLIFISLFLFSCKKSSDSVATRLLRTESTDYNGNVFHSEYGYDKMDRITTITEYENNEPPAVAVTISYHANEAVLLSFPDDDPVYNQNKEVHLTLDANGRMLKRIEYTHGVAKTPPVQPTEKFRYDTLLCEYDASGLLKKTTQRRYDSTWVDPTYNTTTRLTSTVSYTMEAGNLTSSDEYAVYPVITRKGGIITASGGSSEYHNVFRYTKSFPNKSDFKNSAVLNEYLLYYEPPLNISQKNMPEQVIRSSTDKDINGSVIFTGNSTIDIERSYNADGLMSSVNVLSHNTPYSQINYFYGR